MNTPDLAVIGAGYWGKNLARNFLELGSLHTLCDSNRHTLDTYSTAYSEIRRVDDAYKVLDDVAIKKVVIAVPAAQHHRLAKAALMAGKDVYVEKPLCLDVADAEEIISLAQKERRILMVGHLLQYHPCVTELQRLVARGELGRLQYITSNRLNLGKFRYEENVLWSFAPHDISVILSLVGNQLPEQVRCFGESFLTPNVADTALTVLHFADKVRAHVYVSWLNPYKEQRLTVVGTKGMVVFDDTKPWKEKLVIYRDHLIWSEGPIPTPCRESGVALSVPEQEPLREECLHFLGCCTNRSVPRTDGLEGLRVLQVLKSAQASLERDGDVVKPGAGRHAGTFAHSTAVIDQGATIGSSTKIWHFAHISSGARIGEKCIFGQNTFVAGDVVIGNNVKVQNNVAIYTGTVIEDDVFLGPSCVLTNVSNPRSEVNRHSLYEKTLIRRGATIGANATVICGIVLGRYCFVAAGAIVTTNVPDYALMQGVPARHVAWISRHGHILKNPDANGIFKCPESGLRYRQEVDSGAQPSGTNLSHKDAARGIPSDGFRMRCLDLNEEASLPRETATGKFPYDYYKRLSARSD